MRLAVLFSGGKDSCYALWKAMQDHHVVCLITLISENKESFMFHTPNIHLTTLQAKAMNIPILIQQTAGVKETELADLTKAITCAKKKYAIEGIVTGALASVYQATRIQNICAELHLWCFNPLWQANQETYLRLLLKQKFHIIISGVFAYPFTKAGVGKRITISSLKQLLYWQEQFRINPSGEGGEYESLVLDAPMFKKKIKIIHSTTTYDNYCGTLNITRAVLEKK